MGYDDLSKKARMPYIIVAENSEGERTYNSPDARDTLAKVHELVAAGMIVSIFDAATENSVDLAELYGAGGEEAP